MNPAGLVSTDSNAQASRTAYALMTAAYNEEAFIEKTIASVLAQTLLPQKWVIVSDGSIDGTDAIIERYARDHEFIQFLRVTRPPGHSFSSKVIALRKADSALRKVPFCFIGNIDADVSVGPSYFENLIAIFERLPRLGLVSGFVYEDVAGQFMNRKSNRVSSVPHAAQLLRRECYEAIGGYTVLKYGGEDWYAQTCAKMKGWEIRAFPALPIFHHKHTGSGINLLRHRFRLGRLDYSFGSHPAFEIVKCLLRLPEAPIVVGAMQRLLGFTWCCLCREPRVVTQDFSAFLRKEQMGRFTSFFRSTEDAGLRNRYLRRNS